jgi:hypothetical protein
MSVGGGRETFLLSRVDQFLTHWPSIRASPSGRLTVETALMAPPLHRHAPLERRVIARKKQIYGEL